MFLFRIVILNWCKQFKFNNQKLIYWVNNKTLSVKQRNNRKSYQKRAKTYEVLQPLASIKRFNFNLVYTLTRVTWVASGSLLKFPLIDFNDYDDNWGRF